jgi:NAD(P)H-hydrate repair Nnr-like enzyme with NAD(P)H-hydrate dehydratase domain
MATLKPLNDHDVAGLRARAEALYDPAYRPATAPRFERFIPGPAGEMWVESYSEETIAPRRAVVLDASGTHVANATIPAGLTPHIVSWDRLIGVQVDSLGVERVAMHRIRR